MELFKRLSCLHGFVLFILLRIVSKGSACEISSSPECFRKNEEASVYCCSWNFSANESDYMFHLYYKNMGREKKLKSTKDRSCEIIAEEVVVGSKINIFVKAQSHNSSCESPRWSGVLMERVQYEAPQNISMSWLRNDLSLKWEALVGYPSLAEVMFWRHGHHPVARETRLMNTTHENSKYKLIIENLVKNSAYLVRIRHRSAKAKDPLWSHWSSDVLVPAELEREPKTNRKIKLENGTRKVMLTWEPMPQAAAVSNVTFLINDSQLSAGCPCRSKKPDMKENKGTVYVSYSPVNISIVAKNSAGFSPRSVVELPAAHAAANLPICDETSLYAKLKRNTCLELHKLQDASLKSEKVVVLTDDTKQRQKMINKSVADYTQYLYFEHKCVKRKPQTVKMCIYYQKEGVPDIGPLDLSSSNETQSSAQLSWKPIPIKHQRGFITHYDLCAIKTGSDKKLKVCFNISSSKTKHRLGNLTSGATYNISLAGVTRVGEGLQSTITIKTLPEKSKFVWLSFSLLIGFFLFSMMCTVVFKRIKNKILPPVPTPVIPHFTLCEQLNEKWERQEEVDKLTLLQLLPDKRPVSDDIILRGEWDNRKDLTNEEDERNDFDGSSDDCETSDTMDHEPAKAGKTDIEQMGVDLALLIYRNGLVFDVKTDSA